jgi:lysophospholipase L1-like esterase
MLRTRRAFAAVAPRVGLIFFGCALALGVVEVLLRLFWAPVSPPTRPAPRHPPDPSLKELLGIWELGKPNNVGLQGGRYYRTNSAGFRGPEYSPEPAPGVFRIVVTGDSVTVGAGVEFEDTYAARLQEALNRTPPNPARRYEVLNVALAGINARNAIDRLELIGMRFSPQLVIYGVTINDLEGAPGYRQSRQDSAMAAERYWRQLFDGRGPYLLRAMWPRAIGLFFALTPRPGTYTYEALDNWLHNDAARHWFEQQLDRFRALADKAGICAVIFIHPALHQLDGLHPYLPVYRWVREVAAARGLAVVDPWPHVRGMADISLWVNVFDSHPNERGHELFAEALFEGLQKLPEACWHKAPAAK